MDNFLGNMLDLNQKLADKSFSDKEVNVLAKQDFKYLCSQTGYNALNNIDYIRVEQMNKKIIDVFVVGHDLSNKNIEIPGQYVDVEKEDLYVGVVYYENGKVKNICLFKAADFAKRGIFSMFKYNKGNNTYNINLPNEEKLKQYSFGYVIKNISKGE